MQQGDFDLHSATRIAHREATADWILRARPPPSRGGDDSDSEDEDNPSLVCSLLSALFSRKEERIGREFFLFS